MILDEYRKIKNHPHSTRFDQETYDRMESDFITTWFNGSVDKYNRFVKLINPEAREYSLKDEIVIIIPEEDKLKAIILKKGE